MSSMSPKSTSDVDPNDDNLEQIPTILYKYRSFDPCSSGIQLASNGEAYFASAKDFNDPFDSYFIPTSVMTACQGEELVATLRRKAREHRPGASESEMQELVKRGERQHQRFKDGDPKAIEPVLQIQYDRFGICSLAADPGSLPMWAYYGDSHKGMCIGLRSAVIADHQRMLLQQDKMLILYKVRYSASLPKVCIDIGPRGMPDTELRKLEATLYSKSERWKHECEYRLIFHNHSGKSYIFGSDVVAEVLVGSRADDADISALLKQLNMAGSKATVKRAVRSQSIYALEFETIQR